MAKKGNKHNYPKQRKPRNTSYSVTQQILKAIPPDVLYEIWKTMGGHLKTAKYLTELLGFYVSNMVIQYIAQRKFKWVRTITNKNLPLYRGVLNGKVDPEHYKTIIFA